MTGPEQEEESKDFDDSPAFGLAFGIAMALGLATGRPVEFEIVEGDEEEGAG